MLPKASRQNNAHSSTLDSQAVHPLQCPGRDVARPTGYTTKAPSSDARRGLPCCSLVRPSRAARPTAHPAPQGSRLKRWRVGCDAWGRWRRVLCARLPQILLRPSSAQGRVPRPACDAPRLLRNPLRVLSIVRRAHHLAHRSTRSFTCASRRRLAASAALSGVWFASLMPPSVAAATNPPQVLCGQRPGAVPRRPLCPSGRSPRRSKL